MIKRVFQLMGGKAGTVARIACGLMMLLFAAAVLDEAAGRGMLGGVGAGLIAAAGLIVAALFCSGPVVALVVRPFHAWIDSIYLGSPDNSRPELTLRLARFYCSEGRWDEALAEYRKQLDWHPREKAVLEEAKLAALRSGDRELIDEWCGGGPSPLLLFA